MALMKCNECDKEISDKSKVCVHCGAPVKTNNKKPTKKVVMGILIIGIIAVILVIIRIFFFTPIKIYGPSMSPTLESGDIKILNKMAKIERFDIIAFECDNEIIVKRVYGMPGETIKVENDEIYINDKKIGYKYAYVDSSEYETINETITLKDDEYFVLGDNLADSKDSRKRKNKKNGFIETTGTIKKESIKGVLFNVK